MRIRLNPFFSSFDFGNQFLILNNEFYFFASNSTNGFELWKSDGTQSGSVMVKDIRPGSGSSSFRLTGRVINNQIIFTANDGVSGTEIWRSDGTELGTFLVKNINNTSQSSFSFNNDFKEFNGFIYFIANDVEHGAEIWKTDGTNAGTTLLKDINTGTNSIFFEKFFVDQVHNKLLFYTSSSLSGNKTLWASDGSSVGTQQISDIQDSNTSGLVENFISVNNTTVLTGMNSKYGNELWKTDGTSAGTTIFADLNHSSSSAPSNYIDANGDLFFIARGNNSGGTQLFKSDGTVEGTIMVKDINPGFMAIDESAQMKSIANTIFFSASNGINGFELWKSDGTDTGTVMVKDINTGSFSSMLTSGGQQQFSVINNILFFSANDGNGNHGAELWKSDGTEPGTVLVKDLIVGGSSSLPREFVLFSNKIFFIANGASVSDLWSTDGTNAGTQNILSKSRMGLLHVINNRLVFVAETSGTTFGPHDLWVSDGTQGGTNHIKSFGDNIDSDIQFARVLNDEMYFVAKDPVSFQKAVFKTNGTIEGTTSLFDGADHPTFINLDINTIESCGNFFYFIVVNEDSSSEELWRTNGFLTEKIADSNTTTNFSFFRNLECHKENLFYLAQSQPKNIWVINDNLNQPILLDINVTNSLKFENDSEWISELASTSRNFYFTATSPESGEELFITEFDPATLSINEFNIEGLAKNKILTVYPNPAHSLVNIISNIDSDILKYELFDISGRKIKNSKNNVLSKEMRFDTDNLTSGIYLLKTFLNNGSRITTKLLINR